MGAHHRSPRADDFFDSVVKNAIDFLKKSVSELQKHPKYSVINFCSALEIFLKARLMLEHWALIVTKPDTANLAKFRRGDFHSVALDEAIRRLRDIADEPISKEEEKCFQMVREHRNKLVHFFHAKYTNPPDTTTIQEVVSEQCKAWFYLHRLLTTKWGEYFERYAKQIEQLNKKMHRNRVFLGAKYDAIKPEIQTDITAGIDYSTCFSCGFAASRIEEIDSPYYESSCRVCNVHNLFLRVQCPHCDGMISIEELGEGECSNCGFTTDIDWLVAKLGPQEDPKEESEIAYCSSCEYTGTPTAIPFGEGYLCLSCMELHHSADKCGWCFQLVTGIDSSVDSYLAGCVLCEGLFAWKRDE